MAHIKAGGAKAHQGVNVAGKRRGIKVFAGEFAKAGYILVRQKGTVFHAGKNVRVGRDHTLYAVSDGYVSFRKMSGYKRGQKYVDVVDEATGNTKVSAAGAEGGNK
jgi:large subunit ribosomal protein L27